MVGRALGLERAISCFTARPLPWLATNSYFLRGSRSRYFAIAPDTIVDAASELRIILAEPIGYNSLPSVHSTTCCTALTEFGKSST